jgi:hypothetical protein
VSWASEALGAIRKIVLIEDRMEWLSGQVNELAEACRDTDRRLVRLEAKFELIERVATTRRSRLREKPES